MTAFRRGVNDSAKIWAMLLPLVAIVGLEVTAFTRLVEVTVAVAMMIGSLVAGARVTKNLAFRVTPMSCTDSVTANVVTASIIIAASLMSFPVASSHVVSGAILGVGLASNRHALRWATIAEIATAWLLTLPAAAVLSVTLYLGIIEARRADGFEIWLCVMAAATAVLLMLLIYRRGHSGGSAMSGAASLPMTSSLGLRLIVFVCNSNTSRSPMAAQICKAVLAKMRGTLPDGSVDVLSRGISAIDGETMGPLAANALAKLGIVPKIHRASNLSLDIAEKADLILCMTDAQVRQVIEVFPSCLAKVFRLHPDIDVPNPAGLDQEAFESVARLISKGIGNRMEQIITV
jgi:protein-tyrosine-phosphatase